MHHLARLLGDPGREFHVLDLVAAEIGSVASVDSSHAGEMLDARAKDAYRRRLAEIDEDLEQAQAIGDGERAAQADAERDFLLRELSLAVGLSGRDRRAGSPSERARAGVTRESGRRSPGSQSINPSSASTLAAPFAPAPTAPTCPTRASRRVGILMLLSAGSTTVVHRGQRCGPQRRGAARSSVGGDDAAGNAAAAVAGRLGDEVVGVGVDDHGAAVAVEEPTRCSTTWRRRWWR